MSLPAPVHAQNLEVIRYVAVPVPGPFAIDGVGGGLIAAPGETAFACALFHDVDARPLKSVRIEFALYDGDGNLTAGPALVRTGTFDTGVRVGFANPRDLRLQRES